MASSLLLFLTLILAAIVSSEARIHLVGNSTNGWRVYSSSPNALNEWAESESFHPNDYIVFKFRNRMDAVLEVSEKAYERCITSDPIRSHPYGHTIAKLREPRPYYFIARTRGACRKGEKLAVSVTSSSSTHTAAPSSRVEHHGKTSAASGVPTMSLGLVVAALIAWVAV